MSKMVTITLKAGLNPAPYAGLEGIHNQKRLIDVSKRTTWVEVLTKDFGATSVDPTEFVIRRGGLKGPGSSFHALTAPVVNYLAEYKAQPQTVVAHLVKTHRRSPIRMVVPLVGRRPAQAPRVKPEPAAATPSTSTGPEPRLMSAGSQSQSYQTMVEQAKNNTTPGTPDQRRPKFFVSRPVRPQQQNLNGNQNPTQPSQPLGPKKRPVPTAAPQQPNPKQPRGNNQTQRDVQRQGNRVLLNSVLNENEGTENGYNGQSAAYDDDDLDSQVDDLPRMGITFESVRKRFNENVQKYKNPQLLMAKKELERLKREESDELRKYSMLFPLCMYMIKDMLMGPD